MFVWIAWFAAYDDLSPHYIHVNLLILLCSGPNDNQWLTTHRFVTNSLQLTLTNRISKSILFICIFFILGKHYHYILGFDYSRSHAAISI